MQILSPYKKDVLAELRDIYGFNSIEAAKEFIINHLQQQYRFSIVSVEALHVAYGLVAKLKANSEVYHLKFASRSMHQNPDQLFSWLNYGRQQGLLLPEVIPSVDGNWYLSPLESINSDYDIVYLMRNVRGKPMKQPNELLLRQYAEAMAQFHHVGFGYPHSMIGNKETWQDKWNERHELYSELKNNPSISQDLLSEAIKLIDRTQVPTLPQTILHGDFRFCHVFFEDNILSGLIDVDESAQGERLIDLCYGLVSGSSPQGSSILTFEQLRSTLKIYHQCSPLNEAEQSVLKGVLTWALIETLCDLSEFQATQEDIEMTQMLLRTVLDTTTEELWCGLQSGS